MSTSLPPPQSSSTSSPSQYVPPAPDHSADILPFPQPAPEAPAQSDAFASGVTQPQAGIDVIPRRPFNLPGYFPFRLPATRSGRIALALGVVYLVWGSTYMAVHLSLESFPPLMLSGLRNL